MARFTDRATTPIRGPRDLLEWKLGAKEPRTDAWDALDEIRPGIRTDGAAAFTATTGAAALWIGHASWIVRLGGATVAIDPVFSRSLGPGIGRLVPPGAALDELPKIDVVLVTHDHRDHMDLPTVAKLPDDALYIVPLGNGPRLHKPNVVELDWWQDHQHGGLTITLVPARHWSMRMPWNRNDTLWGGYVLRAAEGALYHSGDTAWGDHFAEIGERAGPVDWAMLPIGAYAPRWFMSSQHIDPDEAGRAFDDLGARTLLAMHWGTFRLTDEPIGEPPAKMRAWWAERGRDPDRLWIMDVGEARPLTR